MELAWKTIAVERERLRKWLTGALWARSLRHIVPFGNAEVTFVGEVSGT